MLTASSASSSMRLDAVAEHLHDRVLVGKAQGLDCVQQIAKAPGADVIRQPGDEATWF